MESKDELKEIDINLKMESKNELKKFILKIVRVIISVI